MEPSAALERVLERASGDPAVVAAFVFGSRARDDAGSGSDLDVCLVTAPGVDATGARLRYLEDSDADIQVFEQLPLYIRTRVLRDGRVVMVKDEDALYALALRTVKAYEDFRPHYRRYLEAVAGAGP